MSDYTDLVQALLSESEEQDLQFRNQARTIYDQLKSALEKNKDDLLIQSNDEGYIVRGKDIDNDLKDFIFKFVSKGRDTGYAFIKDFHVIHIPALKAPNDPDHLETRLVGNRDSIIHELIHALDQERIDNDIKGSSDIFKRDEPEDYFNHPNEINAYYQEGVASLEQFFDEIVPQHKGVIQTVVQDKADTFEKFSDWAFENFFNEHFIDHLDQKNKRKILKRLSRWYNSRPEFK